MVKHGTNIDINQLNDLIIFTLNYIQKITPEKFQDLFYLSFKRNKIDSDVF